VEDEAVTRTRWKSVMTIWRRIGTMAWW
jgi:hypothetical protein